MDDINLWLAMKNGNRDALETIYRNHAKILFSYGMRFSSDRQLVEDSIQDLFIELWKNRQSIGHTDSIIRYLMTSLRRKIIRKGQQLNKTMTEAEDNSPVFGAEIAFDEQWIAAEDAEAIAEKLQEAIKSLSARQQEAIYLKYKEGLDYDDICKIMDVQYQSARNLVGDAIRNLRKTLEGLPITILLFYLFFLR